MSWASWFFDWLEDLEDKKDWEESGKPYYIQDDEGKFKRVSAIRYENYLLDRGFSPKAAREYMQDHAFDPDLPPPQVMSVEDSDDQSDPPPAEFFDDPDRPDPPPYDFFNDDEDSDF